jgi:hypothetical protein
MRNLNELEVTKGRRQAPAREDVISLETLIGRELPEDYLSFLLEVNGGCPLLDTFSNEKCSCAVNDFFFLGDETSSESLAWNYRNRPAAQAGDCLPFAGDGGGNLFLLDLADGSVKLWIHDEPGREISHLARNFCEFIDGLEENPDYI